MSSVPPSPVPLPQPAGTRPRWAVPLSAARNIDPFRILRRHMVLIIASAFLGVFLGVAAFFLFNQFLPIYSGEVLFEIRAALSESTDIASRDITQDDLVLRLARTEGTLMVSRRILEAAVKEPDIQATTWFRKDFIADDGFPLIDEAVDELEEDVTTRLIRGSNLFGLRWSTGVAVDVPRVLNTIARKYIASREEFDRGKYNANRELFDSELVQVNRNLDDLAQEIDAFIREKGITSLDDPRSHQLSLAMAEVVERIAEVNAALSYGQTAYQQMAAKLDGTVEPSDEDRRLAMQNPTIQPQELAMLQSKTFLRQLRGQYRDPGHWGIRKEQDKLNALEIEYEVKLQEIMSTSLEAQLRAIGDGLEGSRAALENLEQEYQANSVLLQTLAADMARFQEMEERQDHLEQMRQSYIELINEVRLMRLREDASRIVLVQRAETPREKSFPRLESVLPLTIVIVVGLVTGLIFLRELTDQRVKTASDLEVLPGGRVLGVIPELLEDPCKSEAAELVVRKCPTSVLAESYRQTCATIDRFNGPQGHRTMLIVGGLPGSGTTTIATNLAAAAAASGRKVVVVDANFRRPRLSQAMGRAEDGPGLGEVLGGSEKLDDVIWETEFAVDVIGAGRSVDRVFERLSNSRFDNVMADLRRRYDLILVDAPPAVVAGDAMVLATKLDAAILVVRASQEQRGLVARLVNELSEAHCELLGIILNRPRGTVGGYFKKNFAAMAHYASESPA